MSEYRLRDENGVFQPIARKDDFAQVGNYNPTLTSFSGYTYPEIPTIKGYKDPLDNLPFTSPILFTFDGDMYFANRVGSTLFFYSLGTDFSYEYVAQVEITGSLAGGFIEFDGAIYFVCSGGVGKIVDWELDTTYSVSAYSGASLGVCNNELYYYYAYTMYKFSAGQFVSVADFSSSPTAYSYTAGLGVPSTMAEYNGKLYFWATNSSNYPSIWSWDPDSNTRVQIDYWGSSSAGSNIIRANGKVYYLYRYGDKNFMLYKINDDGSGYDRVAECAYGDTYINSKGEFFTFCDGGFYYYQSGEPLALLPNDSDSFTGTKYKVGEANVRQLSAAQEPEYVVASSNSSDSWYGGVYKVIKGEPAKTLWYQGRLLQNLDGEIYALTSYGTYKLQNGEFVKISLCSVYSYEYACFFTVWNGRPYYVSNYTLLTWDESYSSSGRSLEVCELPNPKVSTSDYSRVRIIAHGNRLYSFGGKKSSGSGSASVETNNAYYFENGVWTKLPDTPMLVESVAICNDILYVFCKTTGQQASRKAYALIGGAWVDKETYPATGKAIQIEPIVYEGNIYFQNNYTLTPLTQTRSGVFGLLARETKIVSDNFDGYVVLNGDVTVENEVVTVNKTGYVRVLFDTDTPLSSIHYAVMY